MSGYSFLRFSVSALSGVAALARSAGALAFAAPTKPVISDATGSALRVPLALIFVVALVLGAAWLMRRVNAAQGGTSRRIQILSQVSLGARERAVLIQVSGHELLLGVAPGSVRTLMELPPGTAVDTVPAAAGATSPPTFSASFREVLRRSIGR